MRTIQNSSKLNILHTADWHIGKVLHKHALQDELELFSHWLLQTIEEESIDLLLVSGDIFDLANPSAKDRAMYYGLLSQLSKLSIQIIITGGNHDSVGLLNAPKDLLQAINVKVIGGATENIADELIEVRNKKNELVLIVAAVPFLRDKDLRNKETDEAYANRTEAIRAGIKLHYETLAKLVKEKHPKLPVLAMGHLYTIGADPSESERDIHVGNAAAVEASIFNGFDYVALGHIHRPQIIAKNEMIRYSGSPIALSFSEKDDTKSVVILSLDKKGKIGVPSIKPVPKFRALKKFKGDLATVSGQLKLFKPEYPLTSFVEIEVLEKEFSALTISAVEDLKSQYEEHETFKILKGRTFFESGTKDTSDLFRHGENIEDLQPGEVFKKRLELEGLEKEQVSDLSEVFQELLEIIQESEEA